MKDDTPAVSGRIRSWISWAARPTFIVRTVRQQDSPAHDDKPSPARFTVFLESHTRDRSIRLVLPAKVTELIARQRDALTDRSRSATAKRVAQVRKANGAGKRKV